VGVGDAPAVVGAQGERCGDRRVRVPDVGGKAGRPVCLPQWHVGIVFVDVVFLAGNPIEAWGWFAGPEVFISC